ncbi:MAG TPA: YopX family protein [Chryseosolibacter sp.]|nr:YopX family protein [Chryseosolibacter sp.]
MKDFKPRKLMFKAWNTESRLLMRLNSIECVRGELVKKNHIILQFTGLYDTEGDEIYEMDLLLKGSDKYVVMWDIERNGWCTVTHPGRTDPQPLTSASVANARRLWSIFESEKN